MATDTRIGTELAGYRIEEAVGRGGMGVVYRAEQIRLGRKVALKLLAPELAENEGFRARFEHESRLAAAIDHPNIVPLYEAGEADGLLFLTMRYVEGTDLRDLLARKGRLDPQRAIALVGQVAAALDAAHARGLVHRDVKPGNILLDEGTAAEALEHCYLVDFGLTKDTSSGLELTATGTFVGTIDYVAPEQIEGAKPDGRADQYSLACVLFECLSGHPPYPRDSEVAVMWAHLQDRPPSVTAERPDLPAEVDAILAQAMAKAAEDRYPTCTAMMTALRAAFAAPPAPAPAPTPATPAPAPAGATRVTAQPPADATRLSASPGAAPPLAAPLPAAETAGRPAPAPPTVPHAKAPAEAPVEAPRRAPRRLAPALALGAVLVAGGAVAGVLAGGGGSETAAGGTRVTAGALELRYEAPWAAGGGAETVRGLALTAPIALRAADGRVVAGRIADPGPALLPPAVGAPATTDLVVLGETPALRHMGVSGGPAGAIVYVVPTDRGPQALACTGTSATECEAVAATLRLRGARALDVRPSAAYARGLGTLLQRRADADARTRRLLAAAATSRDQAPVARAAAREQERLAAQVRELPAPAVAEAASAAVADATASVARAYGRMATAARERDAARFRAARTAVARGDAALARAIGALGQLGYEVRR